MTNASERLDRPGETTLHRRHQPTSMIHRSRWLAVAAAIASFFCATPAAMTAQDPDGQGGTKAMFATKA
jgi:hypothetical protein